MVGKKRVSFYSTAIAAIQQWQSENAIKFCSFDMGGSDVYKIIHQYFLEKSALYLIVYDHAKFSSQVRALRTRTKGLIQMGNYIWMWSICNISASDSIAIKC